MRQLKISKQITNRESQSLDRYLTEVNKMGLITADEEVDLTKRIREGDTIALEKMVNANLRFVISVAKQYQNRGMSLGDLINEGNVGLVKAATRFDEKRGFKFISYAVWWIRQSIIQALSEQSRIVRLPLNRVGAISQIANKTAELEQKLLREPTAEELADALELRVDEVHLNRQSAIRSASIDAPFSNENEGSLLDVLYKDDIKQPDDSLEANSLQLEIQRALNCLSSREAIVLCSYFGLNGYMASTLEEIAEKLALTRERVRQIKQKATNKLRNSSQSEILKTYLG